MTGTSANWHLRERQYLHRLLESAAREDARRHDAPPARERTTAKHV